MKILTIKEPYASFIANGIKTIETRSWKTNYRGEIYIHAGKTNVKFKNEEVKKLAKNLTFHSGEIICKCRLIDCIYMTEEFIERVKKETPNEFILGEYEVGRYGWILELEEILKKPIKAKGQLGIWNYD